MSKWREVLETVQDMVFGDARSVYGPFHKAWELPKTHPHYMEEEQVRRPWTLPVEHPKYQFFDAWNEPKPRSAFLRWLLRKPLKQAYGMPSFRDGKREVHYWFDEQMIVWMSPNQWGWKSVCAVSRVQERCTLK